MRNRICLVSGLMALCIAAANSASAVDYPTDFWVNEEQGWIVESKPCGGGLCGFLVGFRIDHPHPPDYVAVDDRNPDPAHRADPLCGLQLIGGFKPSDRPDGKWVDGWIYDPDKGKTYSGIISMIDADTAKIRAYVGVPLFGRTLILRRETGPKTRCALPPGR